MIDTMPPNQRVTVTLPTDLISRIDHFEHDRSRFIAEAVENEIQRRNREALLDSLRSPHAEFEALANAGFHQWADGLPVEKNALVDPASGTAVRWVEGQGWVEVEE